MKILLGVMLAVVLSANALAEVPPIDEKDLKKMAALVVVGDVIDVQCVPGSFEQNRCYTADSYKATVRVREVKKGAFPGREITLLFKDIRFLKGCVGGSEFVHRVGQRALYYLVPRGDNAWAPVNWSAVFLRRKSSAPLPDCNKRI